MKQDTIQDLGLKMLSKRKRSGIFEIVVKLCNVLTLFYYASKAWRRKTMLDVLREFKSQVSCHTTKPGGIFH